MGLPRRCANPLTLLLLVALTSGAGAQETPEPMPESSPDPASRLAEELTPEFVEKQDPESAEALTPEFVEEQDPEVVEALEPEFVDEQDPDFAGALEPGFVGGQEPEVVGELESEFAGGQDPEVVGERDPEFAGDRTEALPGPDSDGTPPPTEPEALEAAAAPLVPASPAPATGASDGAAAAASDDALLAAYVDGLLASYRAVHGAPGYTVAVVRPDRTVLARGYGLADVEAGTPVDPAATRFYVASISKTFVWTAVMMLVDQGVLDLAVDVNDYLTRYTVPPGKRPRPLTLAHLMEHRAGVEESNRVWLPAVADLELPEAIAAAEPAQVFPRGERAAYSNWASNLAALVIEDATGRSYADFLFEEILEPLGMSTTALDEDSPAARDPAIPLAKNYRVGKAGAELVPQIDLGAYAPIAGMSTTAADMARWMRFHLNRGELDGVRLMSEAVYGELRRRYFDPGPLAPARAHGFVDLPYRSTYLYGHSGSINAFYSMFAVAPELRLAVFIAQNSADSFDPLARVPRLVFDRALALTPGGVADGALPKPDVDAIAAADALAGKYITSRRVFSGLEKLFAAILGTIDLSARDGYLIAAYSNAPFYRLAPDIWENRHGDRLAVIRDDDGKIERLMTPGGAVEFEPVTLLTNPMVLAGALGATAFFSLTSWLGLWRRWRQQRETTVTGRILSWVAILATLPIIALGILAARLPGPDELSFAEVFAQWPLPGLLDLATGATVAAITAVVVLLGLLPAWRIANWSLVRKLHYSAFALAYGTLGLSLLNWGLVPLEWFG